MFSWITNIGETFLTQHRDMGVDVAYVSDYVDNHQQMEIDLKENEVEFKKLKQKAESLFKSEETQLSQMRKNLDTIEQKWNKLRHTVEQRIHVASDYLEFIKIVNQFRSLSVDLQELFKTVNDHLTQTSHSSDSIFELHVQDKMRIFEKYYEDVLKKGRVSINTLRETQNEVLKLNSNHLVSDIELMMNDSTSIFESIRSNLEIWREKLISKKRFKEEWHEFVTNARGLIKRTILIEDNFFPKSTQFENTMEISRVYQKNLDEFMPTVKSILVEIEDFITKAEILSLNGETQGQKDMIINELTKMRQRFVSRINEMKSLLQMSISFFHNVYKLEEIISECERKYSSARPGEDLNTAETSLRQHLSEKEKIVKLVNFTSSEGEEILHRVRREVN